jgi:acyl-CoA thioesterase-2
MGDLAADTAVTAAPDRDGGYTCTLSRDWEIWGPNGGYLASVALRAAGVHTQFERPASIVGHYLGVASFDAPIDITTTTLREAKRAESIRVAIEQAGRPIFEALVWSVGAVDGLEHDAIAMPEAAEPTSLLSVKERLAARGEASWFPFWDNFDERPLTWVDNWDEREPAEPRFVSWYRYVPADTFADPWVDACRSLIICDTLPWPAAHRHHVGDHGYMAPSIDIAVTFHRVCSDEPWLLAEASSPTAHGGLLAGHVNVWARGGGLVATGVSTLLCRPMRPEYQRS